ncbi:hypothetical protein ACPA0F_18190 [Solibacillus silvestris]
MEEKYQLATPIDFIEGETEARDLIYTLADEITSAVIPTMSGETVLNNWKEVFRGEGSFYVDYTRTTTANTAGRYKHSDGLTYPIYKFSMSGNALNYMTSNFKLKEVDSSVTTRDTLGPFTGLEVSFSYDYAYTDPNGSPVTINTVQSTDALFVFIPNAGEPTGYETHLVLQGYKKDDGAFVYDPNWDNFVDAGKIPHSDFSYFATTSRQLSVYFRTGYYSYSNDTHYQVNFSQLFKPYTFGKFSYTANPVRHAPNIVVLKCTPDVPTGITPRSYFVKLSQRMDDFNYFDVNYGVGFESVTPSAGNPKDTYDKICDPATVRKEGVIPTVISQIEAHKYYMKTITGNPPYVPSAERWEMDITNTKQMVSPTSHCFTGRNSTTTWVVDKFRRPDYLVRYWLSVNNSRVAMVIEGDPAPSINDYYRSFGYIGKITPFNQYDHAGNFGVTVGMGHLVKAQTNYVEADIKEDTVQYGQWGEYTSNGMWSMSMFNTRSNVYFQAHHPAFLTQLPDYDAAGTLPSGLQRLVLDDDRFQTSIWTSRYHGSPVYMVHRSEGYRGFMDGVVVIEDHNIVNGDELVVDTYIKKDPNDPSKGTWEEVYKFFSLNTPVNLFTKYSPAPGKVSVAILKEIR